MKLKILSAMCLFALLAGCQSDIEMELERAPLNKISIHSLLDEASQTKNENPDQSLQVALKGLSASQSLQYTEGELRAYSILTSIYLYQYKDMDKAHHYLEEYSKVMKQKESQTALSRYYYNKGVTFYNEERYSDAFRFLIKAKALYEEGIDNDKGLSNTYYTLGLIKSKTFQYSQAKDYLEKAFKLAEKGEYDLIYIAAMEQYGNILLWEGNFRKSNEYFGKSSAQALNAGDYENVADGLNVMGYNLVRLGDYDQAKEKLEQAQKYALEANSDVQKGNVKLNLSYLEGHKGNHSAGYAYLTEAETIFRELKMEDKLMEVYGQLAWHHTNLGQLTKARVAIEYGLEYTASARKIDTDEFFKHAYNVADALGNSSDLYRYKFEQANLELDRRRKNDMVGMTQIEAEHEETQAANRLELDKAALGLEQAQVEKLNLTRGLVVAFLLLLIVAGVSLSVGFINNFRASNDLRKLSKDFLNNSSEILQKYGSGEKI
ncbi:MAG: tetratricopeptide repeat protein [Cyclobacteriaceae bacterium]